MKRFLLWIISVALGGVVLLAAVMGVSYAFTTEDVYKRQGYVWAGREALRTTYTLPGAFRAYKPLLL